MFSPFFKALSPGKKIAFLAVFLALAVAANSVLEITLSLYNKITFTYFLLFVTAFLLGGVPAFAVAVVGDAIGFLISPTGTFWLYGVVMGIFALITGVFMHLVPIKGKGANYVKAAIALVVNYFVVTIFLATLVQYSYAILFLWGGNVNKGIWVYTLGYLGPRLTIQTAVYAGNMAACFLTIPLFERLLFRNRKNEP